MMLTQYPSSLFYIIRFYTSFYRVLGSKTKVSLKSVRPHLVGASPTPCQPFIMALASTSTINIITPLSVDSTRNIIRCVPVSSD
jgi:hypothetical protein